MAGRLSRVWKKNTEVTFGLRLDSFADAITEILFARLLPTNTMPGYGSALANPTLKQALPVAMASFRALRTLRSKSITAHPRQTTGGKTVRLKHKDFMASGHKSQTPFWKLKGPSRLSKRRLLV
jgi:hypothetical protein